MGMAVSVTGICTQTLIQHSVKEEVRGRVMSLWGLIFRGAPAVGVIIMGALSDLSSLGAVVFGSSILCIVAATIAYLRWFTRLRQAFA
jgi:predicted MFS family arabinose efflux permease